MCTCSICGAHTRRLDEPEPLRVSDQEPQPPSVGEGSVHKGGRVQEREERQGLLPQHAEIADVLQERRELGTRLAEDRDFWKKDVVEKVKFHYNYRYPEPIAEAQPEQPEPSPELDFGVLG